jgi:hypothetical protein
MESSTLGSFKKDVMELVHPFPFSQDVYHQDVKVDSLENLEILSNILNTSLSIAIIIYIIILTVSFPFVVTT